jgi:hypothetical protein
MPRTITDIRDELDALEFMLAHPLSLDEEFRLEARRRAVVAELYALFIHPG